MLESIQIVIDLVYAVVSQHNLGYLRSYAECLQLLESHQYIDDERAMRLSRAVGMRNILIHEYTHVNDDLVAALDDLGDFEQFDRQLVHSIQS